MFLQDVLSILPFDTWFCVFVVAMLPLLELRTAIPLGLSITVFKDNVLTLWQSCLFAFLGVCLATFVVLLGLKLFLKILNKNNKFNKLYKKFNIWLDAKFFKYKNHLNFNKKANLKKWDVLFWFTAIPIPFSGAYSAALLSVFLNANFKLAFSAIVLGNLLSTILIALLCTVFYDFVDLFLIVFIIIAVLMVFYYLVAFIIKKITSKKHINV